MRHLSIVLVETVLIYQKYIVYFYFVLKDLIGAASTWRDLGNANAPSGESGH